MSKKGKQFNSKAPKLVLRKKIEVSTNNSKGTIRDRLMSQGNSSTGIFSTPVALGRVGSSRMFRSALPKDINNKPVATMCYCGALLDNIMLVKLTRPTLQEEMNISAQVSRSNKHKTSKKFYQKSIKLENGLLRINTTTVGSPSKGDKVKISVHNIVALKLEKEKKQVKIEAHVHKRTECLNKYEKPSVFVVKLGSEKQAEYFVETLLTECDNYGIVIDLVLGSMQLKGVRTDCKEHMECLIRKRVTMFTISKCDGSASLEFAQEELIKYLQTNEKESRSKLWEAHLHGDNKLILDKLPRSGLNEIRLKRADNFGTKVKALTETVDTIFFGTSKENQEKEIDASYYIVQHMKGELKNSD